MKYFVYPSSFYKWIDVRITVRLHPMIGIDVRISVSLQAAKELDWFSRFHSVALADCRRGTPALKTPFDEEDDAVFDDEDDDDPHAGSWFSWSSLLSRDS